LQGLIFRPKSVTKNDDACVIVQNYERFFSVSRREPRDTRTQSAVRKIGRAVSN
jgi:hypothetical protein